MRTGVPRHLEVVAVPQAPIGPQFIAWGPEMLKFADEMERRDATNPDRCAGCEGRHGAVRICGGCEEPEEDCACP